MSIFGYIFAVALLIFVLVGIWYEEKFIEFEDKICDRLGYVIAQAIIRYRRFKVNVKIRIAEKAVQMLEDCK